MIWLYQRIQPVDLECHTESKMDYNEACLHVINELNTTITMMSVTADCYKCNMKTWMSIDALDENFLIVPTENTLKFGFVSSDGPSCNKTYTFERHGIYKWTADLTCQPIEVVKPHDPAYIPILWIGGIGLSVCIAYAFWKVMRQYEIPEKIFHKLRRRKVKDDVTESEVSEAAITPTSTTTHTTGETTELPVPRIFAFQVFRGLIILLMVMFHGEASRYWFMMHADWNGIMPADYIYPGFLWSMGAVFYLKYRTKLLLGFSREALLLEVSLRSLRYIVLGFCLNTFEQNNMSQARIPGELQRYGLLHFIMFALEVSFMKKEVQVDIIHKARDVRDCWIQGVFTLASMVLYLLVKYFLPVPNCPTGYTGPGGLHMYSRYLNCTGGAARYIDSIIFGNNHLYKYPTCRTVYDCQQNFDPQGILGTFSCFLTVYSGIQAARIFVYYTKVKLQIIVLLMWGITQAVLGLCLCGFMKEEGPIPLNKSLWSLSFALHTSGVAFLVFTIVHAIVDIRQWWSGSPCFEAGLNAMLIYFGHNILRFSFPFSWVPVNTTTYFEYVLMDAITLSFWIFIAIFTFKHNRIILQ